MAAVESRPSPHAHAVRLRGPARAGAPAVLVDVEGDDFLAVIGGALQRMQWPHSGWPATLPLPALADHGAPRMLYRPIHRRFNLLLLDTHCQVFGTPRLDPRKIESAGFVLRRWVGPEAARQQPDALARADARHWQAWQLQGETALGWRTLLDAREADADPDPARRPLARSGNATLDTLLAARAANRPAEAVHRLYPLPPALNDAARRTLLWGLVPTGDAPRPATAPAVDYAAARAPGTVRNDFIAHLSPYLRRAGSVRELPPGRFDAAWLDAPLQLPADAPEVAGGSELQRAQFAAFVRQLALEFDIAAPRAAALRALLDEVPLLRLRVPAVPPGFDPYRRVDTSNFLVACARLVAEPDAVSVDMPERFGPLPEGWTARFADAALDLLQQRADGLRTLQGGFDDSAALYALRAFVRVRRDDGCPPLLVWSEPTPLFRIAPWYASTGAPQARIALPPFDRDSLQAMKPNVAFELPPSLQNLLANNAPADLLDGKGKEGGGLGIGWLCSFSIPIITICAFIALNIVLSLLNLFLRWMPFVKICLPIPTKKG